MENPKKRTAIVYDFDGTLAPDNIQEHSLLPDYLGIDKAEFWSQVTSEQKKQDADNILVYMHLLLEKAKAQGKPLTKDVFRKLGEKTRFFEGVEQWFSRMNDYAGARNLQLEHYIISSGNEELIRGTSIFGCFQKVFASRYAYDDQGVAQYPAVAINYTTKTQYLFRINKGIDNCWDNDAVNRWQPMAERPIPFERMIYIGDGDTDIPSMKMVRQQRGYSVAVFDPAQWPKPDMQRKIYHLIAEDRAHFFAEANFLIGTQLDITVKGVLGRIAREEAGYRGEQKP